MVDISLLVHSSQHPTNYRFTDSIGTVGGLLYLWDNMVARAKTKYGRWTYASANRVISDAYWLYALARASRAK